MESGTLAEMALKRLNERPLIAHEEQAKIYTEAYNAYNAGDFPLAADAFSGLVLADPYEAAYWEGLASARQMEKKYSEALNAWAMAALTDDGNALCHFHAAECLFFLGETEEALKALKLAEERAQGDEKLMKKIAWMKHE